MSPFRETAVLPLQSPQSPIRRYRAEAALNGPPVTDRRATRPSRDAFRAVWVRSWLARRDHRSDSCVLARGGRVQATHLLHSEYRSIYVHSNFSGLVVYAVHLLLVQFSSGERALSIRHHLRRRLLRRRRRLLRRRRRLLRRRRRHRHNNRPRPPRHLQPRNSVTPIPDPNL